MFKNWKVFLGLGLVGVGAYFAYRWYQKRKTLAGYGLGGSRGPRWLGYGRAAADFSTAKAFGAETAQTLVNQVGQPIMAAGDVETAPEGASFSDDSNGDGEAEF